MMKNLKCVCLTFFVSIAVQAKEAEIIQKDKKFSQKEIVLEVGDSISFKNEEKDITHNVFSLGPVNPFELKSQAPGQVSKVEFNKEGVTEVECAIHTGMKLKVTVKNKSK